MKVNLLEIYLGRLIFPFPLIIKIFRSFCQNAIKDITRKELGNDIPSYYEQKIKNKTQLQKEVICKEYVTLLERKQNEEKDCIIKKAKGTKRGKQ